MKFYSFDIDLNPMTLVLKPDLDIINMYMCTEKYIPIFSGSKVIAWTDRQTDTHTHTHTHTQRLDWNYYLPAYAEGKNINALRVRKI